MVMRGVGLMNAACTLAAASTAEAIYVFPLPPAQLKRRKSLHDRQPCHYSSESLLSPFAK